MARVTVEDCLENCENRFALVHVTAKRARELYKGIQPTVKCKNRQIVTSLREIAAGHIALFGTIDDALPASKKSKK